MAIPQVQDFVFSKSDETGLTYYYYMFVQQKKHVYHDKICKYIMRTDTSSNNMQYYFSTDAIATVWNNRATHTYKNLEFWG